MRTPPAYVLKVRCGRGEYVKRDGTRGTSGRGALVGEDVAFTIASTQDQTLFEPYAVRTANTGANGCGISMGASHTLDGASPEAVVYGLRKEPAHAGPATLTEDVSPTLRAAADGGAPEDLEGGSMGRYVVRRLTPRETERLQGMPDDHTDLTGCDVAAVTETVADALGYDGRERYALAGRVARWSKECPDGKRYKAVGNSMAVPCMRWIGERIQMVSEVIDETCEHPV